MKDKQDANFLCKYCATWFEADSFEDIRKIREDHIGGCVGRHKESEVIEYEFESTE